MKAAFVPDSKRSGIALVTVLSLMAILIVLLVGLLTLSVTDQATSTESKLQAQAQSNAKLALSIALGELQEFVGPDQRVTAEADIIHSSGFAGWSRDDSRKHYLGVYSSKEWHQKDGSGIPPAWRAYSKDRNKNAFQRWLVSGDPQQVANFELARSAQDTSSESIELVGTGTLGTDTQDSEKVRVPLVDITGQDDQISGRFGWWVGDEGVKAKVSLHDEREFPPSDAANRNRFETTSPSTMGVGAISGFDGLDRGAITARDYGKVLSPAQLALLPSGNITPNIVRNRFHDITTVSRSVLSDVANGGLKRDLSIPFELPSLRPNQWASSWDYPLTKSDNLTDRHSDFHSIWEFSNSGDTNSNYRLDGNWKGFRPDWWAAKMGYVFAYPKASGASDRQGNKQYLRGPSWLQLRNHYRLYKRELEARPDLERRGIAASDDNTWLMRSYQPFSGWHDSHAHTTLSRAYVGDSPTRGGYYRTPSLWDPFFTWENAPPANAGAITDAGLVPVFTKVTLVLSYYMVNDYGNTRALRLACDAVGTIWNPYNVPIETDAVFVAVKLSGLRWRMEKKVGSGTEVVSFGSGGRKDPSGWEDFPFEHFRVGVCEPNGPGDRSRPTKNIRLMPGEVRTFTLSNPTPENYDFGRRRVPFGSFVTNWRGGSFMRSGLWRTPGVSNFKFILKPGVDPDTDEQLSSKIPGSNLSFQAFMGHFQMYNGALRSPFEGGSTGANFGDMYEIMGVHANDPRDAMDGLDKFEVTFSDFGNLGPENKRAFLAVELRRQASDTSASGLASQIDPRSIVNHTAALGKGSLNSIPEGWEIDVKPVSDFDLIQVGVGDRQNGFFGNSHSGSGQDHIVFFDVPTAPSNSLGALQSVQAGVAGWDAPFTIGSSFGHPKLKGDELIREEKSVINSIPFTNVFHDRAFLTNQGLWDRYFFTGMHLPQDTTIANALPRLEEQARDFLDPTKPNPLTNRRLVFEPDSRSGVTQEQLIERMTHYRWVARHLMLDGGFNINSTRVEAWKAWLSSLKKAKLDQLDPRSGNYSTTSTTDTPFPRASTVSGEAAELWRGYTQLTDQEIDTLAQNIVEQVKLRGPFLSLADFVNRRLAQDETGQMGALQAALEKSGLDTGSGSEKGIPGTIRQSDLLASLGNSITARSDTFVIRAYGEATSGSGAPSAKAWCEVVVQRTTTPLAINDADKLTDSPNPTYPGKNPAGLSPYLDNPELSNLSSKFGRSFKIISFRWLSPDEV